MTLLLRNARLIDPENGERSGTVVIEGGRISQIIPDGNTLPNSMRSIDCGGKCLAPGIVDVGVKVCEPGERHKESFRTAGEAAAAGGVYVVIC